jgi:hypothetical protein
MRGSTESRRRTGAERAAIWLAVLATSGGLIAGCSSSKENSTASGAAAPNKAAPAAAAPGSGGAAGGVAAGGAAGQAPGSAPSAPGQQGTTPLTNIGTANRSLVFTAGLTVRVKDVLSATATAESLATANGGFVGDEKTQSGGPDGDVTIVESVISLRVPNDKYDSVLNQLGTGGVIEQQTRSASDVTDQVVDTTSRINSEQTAINRLTDLIKTASGLNDIVTLEGDLSTREADLDSLKSRLAALQDQTTLSTITVTYHTPAATTPPPPAPKKQNPFTRGLTDGWHAFENVAKVLLITLGGLLPFAVLIAVLWWPARRIYKIRLRALARIAQDRADAAAEAKAQADAANAQRANGDRSKASAAAVADGSR